MKNNEKENFWFDNDKYYWEDDDDAKNGGYASTEENAIKEAREYIEQYSGEVNSVSIYKKIYIATPITTAEIKAVE